MRGLVACFMLFGLGSASADDIYAIPANAEPPALDISAAHAHDMGGALHMAMRLYGQAGNVTVVPGETISYVWSYDISSSAIGLGGGEGTLAVLASLGEGDAGWHADLAALHGTDACGTGHRLELISDDETFAPNLSGQALEVVVPVPDMLGVPFNALTVRWRNEDGCVLEIVDRATDDPMSMGSVRDSL